MGSEGLICSCVLRVLSLEKCVQIIEIEEQGGFEEVELEETALFLIFEIWDIPAMKWTWDFCSPEHPSTTRTAAVSV